MLTVSPAAELERDGRADSWCEPQAENGAFDGPGSVVKGWAGSRPL